MLSSTEIHITAFNETLIERVASHKHLGFWLDDKLCFRLNILNN